MNTSFTLTIWQKKQATLLYHFASMEYLKGLQQRVDELLAFVDPTLDLAQAENRDATLISTRWGTRYTSQNWANNAWQFLKDFQQSVVRNIADRVSEIYNITGASQCERGLSEYSMAWATAEEEEKFDFMFEAISHYAHFIDYTMDKYRSDSRWKDYTLTLAWQEFRSHFPQLPRFQVRTDVEVKTGRTPPRTGVYVSQDDPYGALQFAWTGGHMGKLLECSTFNALGIDALNSVGRENLWINGAKMLAFVQSPKNNPSLLKDPFYKESQDAELAPSLVSRNAFTSRPCKWYFVEMVTGEYEEINSAESDFSSVAQNLLRIEGGRPCPQSGFWLTPAKINSRRYFHEGETMPTFDSNYGATIWQWDSNQDMPKL